MQKGLLYRVLTSKIAGGVFHKIHSWTHHLVGFLFTFVFCIDFFLQFVPNWPLLQEFVTHWKAITNYFIDKKGL